MDKRPEPPPWGRLITQALQRSGMSARKAAKKAGMSDGRWRQITSGYQNVSAGVYAPVRGPAETIARMAQVVGLTPGELEKAGRPDAAEELRARITSPAAGDPDGDPPPFKLFDEVEVDLWALKNLPPEFRIAYIRQWRARLLEGEADEGA